MNKKSKNYIHTQVIFIGGKIEIMDSIKYVDVNETSTPIATVFMRAYIRAPENSKPETIEEGLNIFRDAQNTADFDSSHPETKVKNADRIMRHKYNRIGWELPPFIKTTEEIINEANRLFKQLRELHPNIEEFKQQKEGRRIIVAHIIYLSSHIQQNAMLNKDECIKRRSEISEQRYYQHLPAIDRLDRLGVDAKEFGIYAAVDFVNVIQDIINQYEK